jgi:hypothetical protein
MTGGVTEVLLKVVVTGGTAGFYHSLGELELGADCLKLFKTAACLGSTSILWYEMWTDFHEKIFHFVCYWLWRSIIGTIEVMNCVFFTIIWIFSALIVPDAVAIFPIGTLKTQARNFT